jgi:O-antigen/teichoic acid export membrane protein
MNNMNIGRKDVIWNYAATFLKIGVGVILLPFILRIFPPETVAIWSIFSTVITLTGLFDFGFNPSFARNVSYVMSGVKELKITGYDIVESHNSEIDYSLFKGLINAMRWFYSCTACVLFIILLTAGIYYMHTILKTYSGNHTEVYTAWGILAIINSYSLYTMYYDSLMQGKGLIKRSKQIQIIGQSIYLTVAVILILLRFNLIAIVSAQALSIIIRRILSYRTIYTVEFKRMLHDVKALSKKTIFKLIYPNAVKMGLVQLGNLIVSRSSIILGALFLSLEEIASYGITIQIIWIIASVSTVYLFTYMSKMMQQRVHNDNISIKKIYLKSCLFLFCTFFICGLCLLVGGEWTLNLIKSQTSLLSKSFIFAALLVSVFDYNRGIAECILLTKNEVPFFKASLFTGCFMVVLLFLFLKYTNLGVWSMIMAPCIAQGCYQNWKWPYEVYIQLCISNRNIRNVKNKIKR